jgi:hypothetical protein
MDRLNGGAGNRGRGVKGNIREDIPAPLTTNAEVVNSRPGLPLASTVGTTSIWSAVTPLVGELRNY